MEKTYILDLRDLADNLFYILTKNNSEINKVTFRQIGKHKEIIEREAANSGIKLAFALSRDETIRFFNHNKFMYDKGEDDNSIILREGVTPYHLIWNKAVLPLDVSLLLSNDSIVNETLEMMGVKKAEKNLKI